MNQDLSFLTGGGEMGDLIRTHDWSTTALGAPENWPPALKAVTALVIASPLPMVVLWGPDLVQIHNDGYRSIAGETQACGLGRPLREHAPQTWHIIAPAWEAVRRGEARSLADQTLDGAPRTSFDLTCSALRDDTGAVAGMLVTAVAGAERGPAGRMQETERQRQQQMLDQMPGFAALLRGPKHVYDYVNQAYIEISGPRDFIGRSVREAFPELVGQGFYELLDRVYATGEPFAARALPIRLSGESRDRFIDLLYQPVRDDAGVVTGIFVGGYDITERVRAEQALRESEAFVRHVLESSSDCIKVLSLDARLEFMSAGGLDVMEIDDFGVFKGTPWPDFWHGDERAQANEAVAQANAGGTGHFRGFTATAKGNMRFWDVVVTPMLDADGKPEKLLAISRDISEQQHIEGALRTAEDRLRLAGRATNDVIWDWELASDRIAWNEALQTAYGLAPETGGTTSAWRLDRVHPEDRPRVDASLRAAIADPAQTSWAEEYRFRRADGSYADVLDRGNVIRDASGSVARMVGALLDLSERNIAEARFRELADSMTQFAWTGDASGSINWYNKRWYDYTGTTLEEMQGWGWSKVHHPDHIERVVDKIARCFEAGDAWEDTFPLRSAAGEFRWFLTRAVPVRDGAGRVVRWFGTNTDVTDQLAAEEKLRDLNATLESRIAAAIAEREDVEAALRQSQKMEAVGQLTGGLAHDFNNLLAGISGSLDLMKIRMSHGRFGDLDRYITVAQGAAQRAAALTHRLLAFSRRQTLDPKPTDVNRLIGGIEELIRRTIGPQTALEVVGATGLWPSLIDPGQLENALLNLCINARDAMPDGGRITIETANRWLDRPAAVTHDIPEGQYLSVCVTDTGTGMAPEIIAKVFEPFFTTKPLGEGTGLGLSMIYGFAKQSGGQVRIYSEVGQGTTVCLYLPRYYGEADTDTMPTSRQELGRSAQGETVLIVDDEPSVRMLVTEVLEDLGYTAIEAADSVAGTKVLQSDVRIDLLVTDVGLPGGMNGRQMAEAGRDKRPDLKVLFITGYAENALLGNGHLDPGMQVLTKPFALDALGSRIKDLVEAR